MLKKARHRAQAQEQEQKQKQDQKQGSKDMDFTLDWKEYAARSRAVAAEGCVLLRNEGQALPIREGETVSIFGRIQLDYQWYKSGTGSGGLVNAPYAVSVPEGLRGAGVRINEALYEKYRAFEEAHPFDKGPGWAQEPFSQQEMPLDEETVREAAASSDLALVILGRSSGEDRDVALQEGSWYLSQDEKNMLRLVCGIFRRTAVLLNVGAIMDMSWIGEFHPQAVMMLWQGGCEGGNAAADVLTGKVNPCGKLADTVALSIEDYPSTRNFGDARQNIYAEDIYVGYRYFETFAQDRVMYPFGFGLSYTDFDVAVTRFAAADRQIRVEARATNTGSRSGKEVVQVYYCPPAGKLAGAARNLVTFGKTRVLAPGESQTLSLLFSVEDMASYDDGGATGHRSAWVLEAGEYGIYVGTDVRRAAYAGRYVQPEDMVTEQLEEALAPVTPFQRMKAAGNRVTWETAPLRTISLAERIAAGRPEAEPCRGDHGIRLKDVKDGRASMERFLSQLSDEDLICLSRGEGMCSPKVTPGIAGAFGGVTDSLRHFGIPVAGCSDGPSGIRMDCGTMAFSNPSGTAVACTFNPFAVAQLYECQGRELRLNKIDALLGPGMNIHRNPLNGRNFEYFSEDPYLTGTMAAAELTAMHRSGVTGVIKHFACNNQEKSRNDADAVVSERALREIYLKGFEIAVKKGGASCIMTTYGPVNGVWTAGNYDLVTTILRNQWHFRGLVMTDWLPKINDEGGPATRENTAAMIRAQNDIYMVNEDAASNSRGDNAEKGLADGRITRGDLVRNAANICRVVMDMPVMEFFSGGEDHITEKDRPSMRGVTMYDQPGAEIGEEPVELDVSGLHTEAGSANVYPLHIHGYGEYAVTVEASTETGDVSQTTMTMYDSGTVKGSMTLIGGNGEHVTRELRFDGYGMMYPYLNFYFAQSGMTVHRIVVEHRGKQAR